MRLAAVLLASIALTGCSTTYNTYAAPVGETSATQSPVSGGDADAPDSMRWLFGSGEGAAVSIQTWRMLADYVEGQVKLAPSESVTMGLPDADGGLGTSSCLTDEGTRKPYAAVFDVDETVLLNLGYEYWEAATGSGFDSAVWDAWEKTGVEEAAPVPGAVTGLRRLRAAGVTVVFNTNRLSENAENTIAALKANGLGDAVHGGTLFLKGDDAMGSAKDGRRAMIAAKYCVLALAGDNLGDFADLLNKRELSVQERRQLAGRGTLANLWGNGWFAIPNPIYGPSIRGSVDDVFPPATHWAPVSSLTNEGE